MNGSTAETARPSSPPASPGSTTSCGGGLHAAPPVPRRGRPRRGQDDAGACSSCSKASGAARRACTSRCRRPRRSSTAVAAVARVVARRDPHLRAGRRPRRASPRTPQNTMFHPSEVELGETTKARARPRSSAVKPQPRRVRLALGDAAARPEPAALPPADPGAQAVLRRAAVHGAAARRPHADGRRPAAAEHRARRDRAGAALARSTGPSGGGCGSCKMRGAQFRGGYHDFVDPRAAGCDVFPRLVAAEHRARRSPRAGSPAAMPALDALLGGGLGPRDEHAAHGPGRHRQVDDRDPVRRRRRRGAASGRRCSSSTRAVEHAAGRARESLGIDLRPRTSTPAAISVQQVDPAELSPGRVRRTCVRRRRSRRARRRRSS